MIATAADLAIFVAEATPVVIAGLIGAALILRSAAVQGFLDAVVGEDS